MINLSAQITFAATPKKIDVLLFTKHLSVMLKAAIPLVEAIETLQEQSGSPQLKKILIKVTEDIRNGSSLAKALAKFPKVFDHFYVSLVEVSESSGTLDENIAFLADQLSKEYALQKKIQGALLYPGLVLVSAAVMSGFIALFVLPQLVGFFEALAIDLPITTRILLTLANVMKDYGVFIFTSLLAIVAVFFNVIRLPIVKPAWHWFLLKIPLIGKLLAYGQLARFSRNFGVLLRSGVPIARSLEVTSRTLSNVVFRSSLKRVSASLEKGNSIKESMQKLRLDFFPPLVSKMIGVGEKSGNLDETLLYLGDFFEEEIDNVSKNLTTVLEPMLLLGIGLVVGFVALAIITPIYQITSSIRR
jgi:type IV pilus assembly protein PilC